MAKLRRTNILIKMIFSFFTCEITFKQYLKNEF